MTGITPKTDDPIRAAALKAGFGTRDMADLQTFLEYALARLEPALLDGIGHYYDVTKPAADAPSISTLVGDVITEFLPKQ